MATPEQRSWLDAWWSRFAVAPLVVIGGVLLVRHSLDAAHPDLRGTILGAVAVLFGVVFLVVGPRRLDTWLRSGGEKRG